MGRAKGKKLASFELDETIWEAFKQKSTDQGLTASAVLVDLVNNFLQGTNGVALSTPVISSENLSEKYSEEIINYLGELLDDRLGTELDLALTRYLDSRFINGELDSLLLKSINTYLTIALEKEREKTREFIKQAVISLEDSLLEDFKPLIELTEKILNEQDNSSEEVSEEISESLSEEQVNSSEEVSENLSEEQVNSSEEVSENLSEEWQKGDVGYLIEDGKKVEILTLWTRTAKVQEFYRQGQPFKIQIDQLSREKVNEQQNLSLFTFEDTLNLLREWEATKKNSPNKRDPYFSKKAILARLHPYPTPNGEPWSIENLKAVLKDHHIKL